MRACECDEAGRAAAEAVNGRWRVGECGKIGSDEMEECIFEETAAGEDGQAGGFVDDEHRIILVEHAIVKRCGRFLPRRAVPDEAVAGLQTPVECGGFAVQEDFARDDARVPSGDDVMRIATGVVVGDFDPVSVVMDGIVVGPAVIHGFPA